MRTIRAAALAAVAGMMALSGQARADQGLPSLPVVHYTLPNGLQVILHEDHATPTVTVNVWYHVGSKDEPERRNGFAHLFEHLMFQGSKHVGEDRFFEYLERAGASDKNGTTNDDRTNYYETLPSNQLALALWLESDRMGFLLDHVDQATFESQRRVVLNERRQNYEDQPYGMVRKYLREALYPSGHPYHNLTIGSPEDLNAATLADVHSFYKTYYVPNNASLVIAGDIDQAAARRLVDQYFGPLPRQPDPVVRTQPIAVTLDKEVVLHVDAGVELARVYVAWPSPPFFAEGDAALDAVSEVLTSGKTSRLYKRLVYDLQVAKDVSSWQESRQLGSSFEIMATGKPGQTAESLLSVIDEELAKVRDGGVTAEEANRARINLEASLIFGVEGMGQRSDMFNRYAQYTGSPDYFARDVGRYRALTAADLQGAVKQWLPQGKRVVVLVKPNPQAPRAGVLASGG
jgi:zinc protease